MPLPHAKPAAPMIPAISGLSSVTVDDAAPSAPSLTLMPLPHAIHHSFLPTLRPPRGPRPGHASLTPDSDEDPKEQQQWQRQAGGRAGSGVSARGRHGRGCRDHWVGVGSRFWGANGESGTGAQPGSGVSHAHSREGHAHRTQTFQPDWLEHLWFPCVRPSPGRPPLRCQRLRGPAHPMMMLRERIKMENLQQGNDHECGAPGLGA